ncbi:MAG: hypothetical protein RR900_07325, partial [Ruthenibacterium sp.]
MKLKSTNIYYLLGLIPLTVLDFTLGMVLAKSHLWLVIALGALCVLSVYAIIKKFIWVPHSEKSYGNLKSVEFSLPVDYEVDLYESEKMACYDFLVRVAELISPLSFHGERPKLVINPNLRAQYGDAFMQIAAVRELRRYEKKGALRTLLRLVMPVELLLALVLSVFAFQVDLTQYFSFFV